MTRRILKQGGMAVAGLLWVLAWMSPPAPMAGASAVPREAQAAFEKKAYQQALDELAKLDKERSAAPDVRRLKIRSLINIGKPKEALDEYGLLTQSLKRDDELVLREVALGMIVVLVKDMREQMRGAAYTALKEIDSADAVPFFEDGLSDGSAPVRALAVEGLGRTEAGRKSKKLRGALEDPAGEVKARVVKALGRSGDHSVLPLIETAAKDELSPVRIAAYAALIRLGKKEAWEDLRKAADAANPDDRTDAIRAMADLKDQRGAPLFMELLTYSQPSVRGIAARGLGQLGRKEAREKIELLLKDPIPGVRESAVSSLADLHSVESVPAISLLLSDGQMTVRAAAVASLLQLGQPFETVVETARALAQQSDTAARASIAFALGKASKPNAKAAVSFLGSLTADPLPGPKIVALRSLGHIGDRELIPLMKDSMQDTNEAVRATAAGALLHLLQLKP
ncbi:HEAT repeat domain-containing protein [Nitrospira sp. NS4]|uniref:HEAT repeat domain-containing protein n=1 Tax=Nitrospira sp. NS4 TaxID=3414498 RepID=UPI003C2F5E4A